eukprot:TRINITY_DN1532_c0_g1_i1.p1 TRINITY_DN1532_c0_g1~~TRINITY_DN1532_c0_g1_i1.p1  ORF type:complete len:386 (+),score=71.16 TRINITY_DN1532_c0_g1_i1:32-1189(+)
MAYWPGIAPVGIADGHGYYGMNFQPQSVESQVDPFRQVSVEMIACDVNPAKFASSIVQFDEARKIRCGFTDEIAMLLLNKQEWFERERLVSQLRSVEEASWHDKKMLIEQLLQLDAHQQKLQAIIEQDKAQEEEQLQRLREQEHTLGELQGRISQLEQANRDFLRDETATMETMRNENVINHKQLEQLQPQLAQLHNQLQHATHAEETAKSRLENSSKDLERLRRRIPCMFCGKNINGDAHPSDQALCPLVQQVECEQCGETMQVRHKVAHELTCGQKPVIGLEVKQVDDDPNGTVKVIALTPGGAAQEGGIEVGDIILKWDGQRVASKADFARVVVSCPIGAAVPVEVIRMQFVEGNHMPITEYLKVCIRGAKQRAPWTPPNSP